MLTFTHEEASRFDAKVAYEALTGCWLWDAKVQEAGYGQFWFRGESIGAHVASWMRHGGTSVGQLHVLHDCDLRCCVNPTHIFLGTHQENMRDMVRKGRAAGLKRTGEAHPLARLSEDDVRQIRVMYEGSVPRKRIAQTFGVSRATVLAVGTGRRWGGLK